MGKIQCFKVYKIIGGGADDIHTLPRSMISKLNFQDGNLNFNKKNIKMNFWFKKKDQFGKKKKKKMFEKCEKLTEK